MNEWKLESVRAFVLNRNLDKNMGLFVYININQLYETLGEWECLSDLYLQTDYFIH